MKTIGLIGGMSWESTLEYYRIINETVNKKLGEFHSARIILYSVELDEIIRLQNQGNWKEIAKLITKVASKIKNEGADFIAICSNTTHKVAENIQKIINLPLLHIADLTAEQITKQGLRTVGLLGTRFTMEEDFYKGRLVDKFGLKVLIPSKNERDFVDNVIFNELCFGIKKESSKKMFLKIIKNLFDSGAEGVILGCTEIPLLINVADTKIPLFDTTKIHAEGIAKFALG
jgi:aspartate racemase